MLLERRPPGLHAG